MAITLFKVIWGHRFWYQSKDQIWWNNANYMAITPLKVFQGHRFWYQSKAHMWLPIVINSNLPPILHCLQVRADYWSNFRDR